jgi:hypothetical protein
MIFSIDGMMKKSHEAQRCVARQFLCTAGVCGDFLPLWKWSGRGGRFMFDAFNMMKFGWHKGNNFS